MRFPSPLPATVVALLLLLLGACGGSSGTAQEHITRAETYLADNEINSSIIELKNALQKEPDNARARWLLGKNYLLINNGASAVKELERAAELGIEAEEFSLDMMQALILNRDFAAAEALYHKIGDANASQDMKLLLGQLYLLQNKSQQAGNYFRLEYDSKENQARARLGLADLALQSRQPERALRHINDAIAIWPDNPQAWRRQGEIRLALNQPAEAETAFSEAVKHAKGYQRDAIKLALASALIAQNKLDEAEQTLGEIDARFHNMPEMKYLQALLLVRRQKPDEATPLLQSVINEQPANAAARLMLAGIKYDQGRYEQAEALTREVIAHNRANLPAHKLLASILLRRNDARAVITQLNAIPGSAQDYQILALKGSAYMALGENDKAIAAYQAAAELAPADNALKTTLAYSQLHAGHTAAAIDQLESIIQLDGDLIQADILLIQTHLKNRDFDAAIAAAKALVERKPGEPVPLSLLGSAYALGKNTEQARAQFNAALKIDPKFVPAIISLAELDLNAKNIDAARKRLESANQTIPDNTAILLALGKLSLLTGQIAEATNSIEAARRTDPRALEPRFLLSNIYINTQNKTALPALQNELLKINDRDSRVLSIVARMETYLGQLDQAQEHLQQLINLNPRADQAYVLLGNVQLQANKPRDAIKSYQTALEQSEGRNADALFALGRIALAQGKPNEARERANALKRHHPKLPAGDALLGDASLTEKQYRQAISHYQAAVKLQDNAETVVRLSSAYQLNGQAQEAVTTLQNWLKSNPDNVIVQLALADLYQKQDNQDSATVQYEIVLKLAPNNVTALNNLAWMYHLKGRPEALSMAEQALVHAPDNAAVLDTVGWIHYQSGNRDKARQLIGRAARLAPNNTEIKQHLDAVMAAQ